MREKDKIKMQNNNEKIPTRFECKECKFECFKKGDFSRHLKTQKHKKCIGNFMENEIDTPWICECGKQYKYNTGYYRHRRACPYLKRANVNGEMNYKEMFMVMINENKDLRSQISELIPKVGNNNNNTIKQKVNINIFLNEQCKDALTMNQFIDKIKVSLDDLHVTKDKGITEGVSNIFIENMNKLSLYERPMHCTDLKREIVYINLKDEDHSGEAQWEKDPKNSKLKDAIQRISYIQQKNLDKWTEEHPNWINDPVLQEEYMQLVKNCTDDLTDNINESKVIKKLCNTVYLEEVKDNL